MHYGIKPCENYTTIPAAGKWRMRWQCRHQRQDCGYKCNPAFHSIFVSVPFTEKKSSSLLSSTKGESGQKLSLPGSQEGMPGALPVQTGLPDVIWLGNEAGSKQAGKQMCYTQKSTRKDCQEVSFSDQPLTAHDLSYYNEYDNRNIGGHDWDDHQITPSFRHIC